MAAAAGDTQVVFGGYSAQAESAWMGAAQGTEVLEQVRAGAPRPDARRLRGEGLFTREFSITQATVLLMGAFLFSALLGALRQVLFNAEFGAGDEASAYYAAFRLPDTLFSLIAGGALSSAMIPVLLSARRDDGEEAAWRLAGLVLTALLITFGVLIVLAQAFAPLFVGNVLAPGFDGETTDLTVRLTRLMLLQPLILVAGSVATALLNSRNQFLLTALSLMSHNLALILGIAAVRFFPELGIWGPAAGVVAGGALQVSILAVGIRSQTARVRLSLDFHDPRLKEVVRLLIPNGLAVGVGYAGFIVDTAFASKAAESAALPAIQNAWLLVGLPIALLGQAAGQAAFPRIAAAAASQDWARFKRTVVRTLLIVVALAVPGVLGLVVLGRTAVRILFEHDEFDAVAGALTTDVLTIYALALPAYVATEVLTRALIALRDTRTPLLTNLVQLVGRVVIVAILLDSAGVEAIPYAFAITATAETVLLAAMLAWRYRQRTTPAAPSPRSAGSPA